MMISSEIGVGLILLLSFIIFAGIGYRKGVIKKIFSVLSLFMSIILAKLLYPFAIRAVVENEFLKGIFSKIWSFFLPVKNNIVLIPKGITDFLPSQPKPDGPPVFSGINGRIISLNKSSASLTEFFFLFCFILFLDCFSKLCSRFWNTFSACRFCILETEFSGFFSGE